MKNRKKIILASVLILSIFVVSGCFASKKKQAAPQRQQAPRESLESVTEDIAPEDQIEFSDPGDDELGQEVKELDSLINETSPSEFDETDLSEDTIETDVELE